MAKSTVKGTKIKLDRSDIIIRTIGYVVVTFYALGLCTSIFDHHRNIIYIGGSDPYRRSAAVPEAVYNKGL